MYNKIMVAFSDEGPECQYNFHECRPDILEAVDNWNGVLAWRRRDKF